MCIETTLGYKFLDLKTAQVVTAHGFHVRFNEHHKLPEIVPVVRIKTGIDTYLPNWSAASASEEKQLEEVPLENDPAANGQNSSGSRDVDLPEESNTEASQPRVAVLQGLAEEPEGVPNDKNVESAERGHIKRFKARLVIHGFTQELGVNYNETYAPVIRFGTIRPTIYYAVKRGWEVLLFDVKTAFLYGDLDEMILMENPPGFQVDGPGRVWRLLKSLYGLKQAPNNWNRTLHARLMKLGFTRTDSDYGFYVLREKGEVKILLTVYVDDLLMMGPRDLCAKTGASLQEAFELTTMGTVKYLLGVEMKIDPLHRQVVYCH
ncbi:Gag-pol Polyprotein [Phytophthora megakarya]|uniref:Gag-pol Polyprotein n=1 Tax=Phytophthora megakarya TaxID=4795 RepID=A0A225VDH3_9STRA|nr:Gag-pol Polyprotein [Phytophthora megakarya]